MDSAIGTAARALSAGDPLAALKLVALRSDPSALALRGISMAQLGELEHARTLLRRAARAFGAAEATSRARCIVAAAEVSLALRDVREAGRGLPGAVQLLARRGDRLNAAMGRLVLARRLVLLGRVEEAEELLSKIAGTAAPPRFVALVELVTFDLGMRRARGTVAAAALERAARAARASGIGALEREVEGARARLAAVVGRYVADGREAEVTLLELEALPLSRRVLVDACRREVRTGRRVVSLTTRPVLLELAVALARRAPAEAPRDELIAEVFGARRANDSHRARLRVEVGRLRRMLSEVAELRASPLGFVLVPRASEGISLLLPPSPSEASTLWALLASGEAWSTSSLAAALGKSQRAVQRALSELEGSGKVRSSGRGRARRWVATPPSGFATTLLLVAPGTLG